MAFLLADLVASAQKDSGKEDDPSVSADEWRRYINRGIKAAFRKVASRFADNWIATVDFSIVAPASSFAFDGTFEQLRRVQRDPTLTSRRPIHPFSLAETPPAGFTGDPRYRVMGRQLFFEPPEGAPGNYRAWFVPRPQLFPATNFAVRVAGGADLGHCSAAGGSIQRIGSGALTAQDGVSLVLNDRMLVLTAPPQGTITAVNFGIYFVADAGSGSTPWILTRTTDYNTASPSQVRTGAAVLATAGIVNINGLFVLGTFVGPVDDPTNGAQNYTAQILDVVMEPYEEYITVYAAKCALEGEKSDTTEQVAHLADLDADIEVMAGAQDAGEQGAVADVEELDRRRWRHPPP